MTDTLTHADVYDASDAYDSQRAAGLYREVVGAKRTLTNRVWELCEALRESRNRISTLEDRVDELESRVSADA